MGWGFLAQAQIYYSKDFEKKGITEFVGFGMDGQTFYWNTALTKPIDMIRIDDNTVKFANNKTTYRFENGPTANSLWCIHSNGRKQKYYVIPTIFISKDFERKGVTEFLQMRGNSVYYFTNGSKTKIRMQNAGQGTQSVRFPGSKAVYTLTSLPMILVCKHPNGKRQEFNFYDVYTLAKLMRAYPNLRKLIEN
ncbi:hypothetical protein BKI52_33980 [marine bacterium AO1-C]|nr:hypothetical protein BKI52_33980 [marine bacterium AO1-C]